MNSDVAVLDTTGSPDAIALSASLSVLCSPQIFRLSRFIGQHNREDRFCTYKSVLCFPSVGSRKSSSAVNCLILARGTSLRSN